MEIAHYIHRSWQRTVTLSVIRILVCAATPAIAPACTFAAAHHLSIPIAPLRGAIIQNHSDEASKATARREIPSVSDDEQAGGSKSIPTSGDHLLHDKEQSPGFSDKPTSESELPIVHLFGLKDTKAAPQFENPAFNWDKAIRQSLLFLTISHAFRLATEPSSRAEMKGPFWRDYFRSVGNLRGWGDGDEFMVNYIGHPMEGAVAGFIQIQNDPRGAREEVGFNRVYWASRLRAFGWAAAYSTQFEIGLFSEASLGNVGLKRGEKSNHPLSYVDLVVTPVVGTAWLVGEDLLDRYVIQRIESKVRNKLVRALVRSFLNPSRSFANMHRGQWFWHRDDRSMRATSETSVQAK